MHTFTKLFLSAFTVLSMWYLTGCNNCVSGSCGDDEDGSYFGSSGSSHSSPAVYEELFPFQSSKNWWKYSDVDGNLFIIDVIDTISDEGDLYYKVAFTEDRLNLSQDDWFIREGNEILFNERLNGTYYEFLPAKFTRNSGYFYSDSVKVDYVLHDNVTVRGKEYHDVVQLNYRREMLHGFDKIYFADNIGIIRMVDEDGRWEIDYVLDSAKVYGVKERY